MNNKGISLIELITVLAILGVCLGLFYFGFILNMQAFDQNIAQADLKQDLSSIIEKVENDGRFAKQIDVVRDGNHRQATFIDSTGGIIGVYLMRDTGVFVIQRPERADSIETFKLDFARSDFNPLGNNGIKMNLTLTDNLLIHQVSIGSVTEVYPRN